MNGYWLISQSDPRNYTFMLQMQEGASSFTESAAIVIKSACYIIIISKLQRHALQKESLRITLSKMEILLVTVFCAKRKNVYARKELNIYQLLSAIRQSLTGK